VERFSGSESSAESRASRVVWEQRHRGCTRAAARGPTPTPRLNPGLLLHEPGGETEPPRLASARGVDAEPIGSVAIGWHGQCLGTCIRSGRASTCAANDHSARCHREPRPFRTALRTLSPQTHAPLTTLHEKRGIELTRSAVQRVLRFDSSAWSASVVAIRCCDPLPLAVAWTGIRSGFSAATQLPQGVAARARNPRRAWRGSRASAAVHGSACVRDDAVGSMRVAIGGRSTHSRSETRTRATRRGP
jgi:hypothetical protein